MLILYLTKDIWVVGLSVEGSESRRDELPNSHFQSKLLKRVKLHSDNDIFIVSLISLYGPCFVMYTTDYCTPQDNVIPTDDRTTYTVRPQHN